MACRFERIDPGKVKSYALSSGAKMPALGMGTFGSDSVSPARVARAVGEAIHIGYRHIDCAMVYGNEREIGDALAFEFRSGLKREELFITSKLWNDKHAPSDVALACEASMRDLGLDYLDLYLIHWPFPNTHERGCTVDSRAAGAKPYIHENYMRTWRELEKLVRRGLVRSIGASNMTMPKMTRLLRDAEIKPAAVELELHPHFQQKELLGYLKREGIVPVGYCPLGSPGRPERDRTDDDSVDLDDPVIKRMAAERGVHPAEIAIMWAVTLGAAPIPFSSSAPHLYSNLRAATLAPLSRDEMDAISGIDRNCRLIKGQVFLWKENQTWHDLWDEDGTIAK